MEDKMSDKLQGVKNKLQPSPEKMEAAKSFFKKYFKIIIGAVVLFSVVMFVYVGYNRSEKKEKVFPMIINHPRDATKQFRLDNNSDKKLPDLSTGEITLSCWCYLKDTQLGSNHIVSIGKSSDGEGFEDSIKLSYFPPDHENPNNLYVYVKRPSTKSDPADDNLSGNTDVHDSCHLSQLPLKKWCHIVVCVWNQNVDVYLNGKLTRSCVLQKPPTLGPDDREMRLTGDGGFSGYISRVQVSNRSIAPEAVYQLYLKGPYSGSWWAKTAAIKSEQPEIECSNSENN